MTLSFKTTLEKVNEAIQKIDKVGDVNVYGTNGDFEVKGVEGRFSWHGDEKTLVITIDRKPFLASDSMIKNELAKFFA